MSDKIFFKFGTGDWIRIKSMKKNGKVICAMYANKIHLYKIKLWLHSTQIDPFIIWIEQDEIEEAKPNE